MERECWIAGAGERTPLPRQPERDALIIAADGGYAYCQSLGLQPSIVVGDFDSSERPEFSGELVQLPCEKDDTDMFYAIKLALERGCTRFHLLGGTGGRADHSMANVQALRWLSRRGGRGWLYGTQMVSTVIENGSLTLHPGHGFVSVFCLGDRAEGVTLTGLKYTLDNATLTGDVPLGVSNERTDQPATVSVQRGALLVMWER